MDTVHAHYYHYQKSSWALPSVLGIGGEFLLTPTLHLLLRYEVRKSVGIDLKYLW